MPSFEEFARAYGSMLSGSVTAFINDIDKLVEMKFGLTSQMQEYLDSKKPVSPTEIKALQYQIDVCEAMTWVAVHSPLFRIKDIPDDHDIDDGTFPRVDALNERIGKLPIEIQVWLYKADPSWRDNVIRAWLARDPDGSVELFLTSLQTCNPVEITKVGLDKLMTDPPDPIEITDSLWERARSFYKRAEKLGELLSEARKKAFESESPKWVLDLSVSYQLFLSQLFNPAAKGVGLVHYTLLGVGSLARGEVCPYSDIDFQLVIDEVEFEKGATVVERKFKEVVEYCNAVLKLIGEPHLDDMQADIANFKPSELAKKHVVTEMDIIQDVLPLYLEEGGQHSELDEYSEEIVKVLKDPARRQKCIMPELCTSQQKFDPKRSVYLKSETKDVKKGLLRVPTFFVRNLVFYYGLQPKGNTLEARCELLVKQGLIDPSVADALIYVAQQALEMRKCLHEAYGGECEIVVQEDDHKDQKVMVHGKEAKAFKLTKKSKFQAAFDVCVQINEVVHGLMKKLVDAHTPQLDMDLKKAELWEIVPTKVMFAKSMEEAMAGLRGGRRRYKGKLHDSIRNIVLNVEMESDGFERERRACTFEILVDKSWTESSGFIVDGRLLLSRSQVFMITLEEQPKPFLVKFDKPPELVPAKKLLEDQ